MVDFRQEVSDDVARMGKSFGAFIEDVGRGVAETQASLDKNSAAITAQLAATEIEVPAVVEQVLDDDGTPSSASNAVNVVNQKMSLIQFIVPTFYQWRHVQLDLSFNVEEIGAIEDFKISKTAIAQKSRRGSTRSMISSASGTLSASDTDQADGSVNARLEPRPDITPPAPFLFRTGPSINFIPGGEITDAVTKQVLGADITVLVLKADGTPNEGKLIKVAVAQGSYTAADGLTTDAEGKVKLEIRKSDPTATKPLTSTLSVTLGIVTGRMDVTI